MRHRALASQFGRTMQNIETSPLHAEQSVSLFLCKIYKVLTQGYQGEESFDNLPVNFGSRRSLKDRAPSNPSAELAVSLIARESSKWFSSTESPGCCINALVYATDN